MLRGICAWGLVAALSCLAEAPDYQAMPALPMAEPAHSVVLDVARAGERLVGVGERGLILYSDDRGQSWQQARVPVSNTLTAVSFVGTDQGWVAGHGGIILHSSDAGLSWQKQFDGNEANRQWLAYVSGRKQELENKLKSLRETTSDSAAISELETALEDAGYAAEDAEAALDNGPVDPFLDIWFTDELHGIAVGAYGMIYRTQNGGQAWQLAAAGIDNPDRYHLYAIARDGDGHIFLSGEAGLMYRSQDGGEHWHRLGPFYDGSLFGVVSSGETVLSYGLRGNVFRSTDAGEHWQALEPLPFSLYGGCRLRDGRIVLVGAAGGIAQSRDAGDHFTSNIHASRSSFAAVSGDGAGDIVVVGMGGALRQVLGERP